VRTSNLARECALGAGLPNGVPAHTVTMACISANQAAATVGGMLLTGQIQMGIAGGAETMSDVPIRLSKPLRARAIASQKAKGFGDYLKLLKGLKLADLGVEAPAIAEYSTGEVMGHSSDRLAAVWGVSRNDQDLFALRSHHMGAAAAAHLRKEIVPLRGTDADSGVRGDSTLEKLQSLKPAFVRPHGTHTAGNSSFLTDGGSATLLATPQRAKELGLVPKAHIKSWIFVSQDPKDELLLGPAYATSRLLHGNGLRVADIDVFEIHEAFAGQVLANLNALKSKAFADRLGLPSPVGEIPMDKVNRWGGSLSIGHPFGATGTRIINTAASRLHHEDGKLALLTACAAGGQAVAMLVERL
jgi:acetyl-CoA acetyltransferase family protein